MRLALVLLATLAGSARAGGDEARVWLVAIRSQSGSDCRVVYISRTEDMLSGDGAQALKAVRDARLGEHDAFDASAATRADLARQAQKRRAVKLPDPHADAVKPSRDWDGPRNQAFDDAHPDACEPVFGVSPAGFDAKHHEALVYVKVHKLTGRGVLVRLVKLDSGWSVEAFEVISVDAE